MLNKFKNNIIDNLENYEKQLSDLEDENERLITDISTLEKSIDRLKLENSDLKSKLNEQRLYKEREESLVLEIAGLKNDLKYFILKYLIQTIYLFINYIEKIKLRKFKQLNIQLTEDNQSLVQELNRRCDPMRLDSEFLVLKQYSYF
jgi:hypothetical protein